MKFSDMALIPVLHTKLFSMTWAPQKVFQLTSEGEALTLKKNTTVICFDEKMANNGGEWFILTTKLFNS